METRYICLKKELLCRAGSGTGRHNGRCCLFKSTVCQKSLSTSLSVGKGEASLLSGFFTFFVFAPPDLLPTRRSIRIEPGTQFP